MTYLAEFLYENDYMAELTSSSNQRKNYLIHSSTTEHYRNPNQKGKTAENGQVESVPPSGVCAFAPLFFEVDNIKK